jgi:hypothetical protein
MGYCQGIARPPKDANYQYDESITNSACKVKKNLMITIEMKQGYVRQLDPFMAVLRSS